MIYIYIHTYEYTYLHMNVYIYIISMRIPYHDHGHPHNPRHMIDTARVFVRIHVYVYLVDGLYRRAELNKHPHCIRVPVLARPNQRCLTFPLPVLAGHYSTEVNSIDEREHAQEYIHSCEYMHIYTHTQTSPL